MKKLLTPIVLAIALASCSSAPARVTTAEERATALALLANVEARVRAVFDSLRREVEESATKPVKWADIYGKVLQIAAPFL